MATQARDTAPGAALDERGIGITGFVAALGTAILVFVVQILVFLYLRRKKELRHVYHPKKDGEPVETTRLLQSVFGTSDDKTMMQNHQLDAYYFLRYLRTLLIIFTPILFVVTPILTPLNYVNGRGQELEPTTQDLAAASSWQVMGLDTLAFGNIRGSNTHRYAAHLVCAVLVSMWFCGVACYELRKYSRSFSIIKELQIQRRLIEGFEKDEPLTTAAQQLDSLLERRNKALARFESSATTLISSRLETTKHRDELVELQERIDEKVKAIAGSQPVRVESGEKACKACFEVRSTWDDVVWSNVGLARWKKYARAIPAGIILAAMIAFWAVPVAWTAALSQLDNLIRDDAARSYLQRHETAKAFALCGAGVLPGAMLALMLKVIPRILEFLSRMCGAKLRVQHAAFVQRYYFVFLFIQMFLVVSVASFFTASVQQFWDNLETLQSASTMLTLLSQNLPSAANYFFSYMILQALSGSANLLMQNTPIFWFLADKMFNYTPWQKWMRGDSMDIVAWGATFPLYTTLACICLVYSVIAPLISLFAIVSFGLYWLAHSYSVINVTKLGTDHGGILYARAINQTFTGIYVMQMCVAGLFFGVRDDADHQSCLPHGIVMLSTLVLTAMFQRIMNGSLLCERRKKLKDCRSKEGSSHLSERLGEHLRLLAEPKAAWLPKCNLEAVEPGGVPVSFSFTSRTTNQSWTATTDEKAKVQLNRVE